MTKRGRTATRHRDVKVGTMRKRGDWGGKNEKQAMLSRAKLEIFETFGLKKNLVRK